ncbi:MAG: helical backbone metal receptor [Dehalococcoidia bacterium]
MLHLWMKSGILVSLLLILALSLPAVSPTPVSATAYPITLTDDLGRQVTISSPPQRIVSLAPSNTEILFALGLGDKIIGVTDYCDYPSEASSKRKVGGPYTPNLETILALSPDLVLAAGITPSAVVSALEDRGLTVFGIEAADLNDLLHDITTVGRITNRETAAANLVSNMQSRINAVATQTAGLSSDQKPRTLHIMYHNPIWTAGQGTFINDLIVKAGGTNIFADISGYRSVSTETVIDRNPQVIIVTSMGGTSSGTWGWVTGSGSPLRGTSAFLNHRIYYVDSNWLERPGPRIILGLEALVEDLHPGIFQPSNTTTVDPIEESIKYGSPEAAAQVIKGLGIDQAVVLLSNEAKVTRERAGQILDRLDTDSRTEIIMAMNDDDLTRILPEVTPEKLFEIPAQQLFSKLPGVSAEQLTGEIPPDLPANLPDLEEKEITYTSATYQASELQSGQWTDFLGKLSPASQFSSGCPITGLMIKPDTNLKDVRATVEMIFSPPVNNQPPGYPIDGLYYKISLDGMTNEDIEAARLTFKVQKFLLDFTDDHKWSVMLNHWDSKSQKWISIPTKRIGEDYNFVYYSAVTSGFSIYTITGSKDIPEQEFVVSDLTITPGKAVTGEKVIIAAEVTNLTDEAQTYPASLWINQTVEQARDVEVPAGGKARVSFTMTKLNAGEYQVRIDRLMGSFEVAADTSSPEITSFSPEGLVDSAHLAISAEYTDEGSGIDQTQIKLLIDGQDEISGSDISGSSIICKPGIKFKAGAHNVELSLADLAGNKASKAWTFNLNPRLPGEKNFARDLDGDGLYEDTNGDGIFDSDDWELLFKNMGDPTVQEMGSCFDFNNDGAWDFGDVVQLFRESVPSTLAVALTKTRCEATQSVSLPITLYNARDGLSGFDLMVSVEDGQVAEFVSVELPDFGISRVLGEFPCSKVSIRAVDLKNIFSQNSEQAILARLKIRAISPGETKIRISLQGMYDENGKPMNPQMISGLVKVD